MPIIQENPTYFVEDLMVPHPPQPQSSSSEVVEMYSLRRSNTLPRKEKVHQGGPSSSLYSSVSSSARRGSRLSSSEGPLEEIVFLSSCESNGSSSSCTSSSFNNNNGGRSNSYRAMRPLKETSFGGPEPKPCTRSVSSSSSSSTTKLKKFGQLFNINLSRSKGSLGSETRSNSTTNSSSMSPPISPLEEGYSLSSFGGGGGGGIHNPQRRIMMGMDEDSSSISYGFQRDLVDSDYHHQDDGMKFAVNMYYNCGFNPRRRDRESHTHHTDDDNYMMSSSQFSTFPNPSRNRKSASVSVKELEHDKDGYLKPTSGNINSQNYQNQQNPSSSTSSLVKHQLHLVDVHTPLETPENSQSTLLAESSFCSGGSYIPFYQNVGLANQGVGGVPSKFRGVGPPQISTALLKKVNGSDCDRFCSLCGYTAAMMGSTLGSNNRMNVTILSCKECFFATNAESYISTFMDKLVTRDKRKIDVKLQSYDLQDLTDTKVAADVHQSKVQIVVISHRFLTRLKFPDSSGGGTSSTTKPSTRIPQIEKVLRSKRVIAVLVGGLTKGDVTETYQSVLYRFTEWFCVELSSTARLEPNFAKSFGDQFIRIYALAQSSSSQFSVFPKKVTKDQGKIAVMLKKPVEGGDEVRVEFACGRRKGEGGLVKMENPYAFCVRVPDSLCPDRVAYVEVSVMVNGHKLGGTCIKADFQSRGGDEDIVEKMSRMVPGFLKLLDDHVTSTLTKNLKECADFNSDPELELVNDVLICRGDEFPTLLHFAAYYGLERTANLLLDEGDGLEQSRVLNEDGKSPEEIAEERGNEGVVEVIKEFCNEEEDQDGRRRRNKKTCGRASVLDLEKRGIVSSCSSGKVKGEEELNYANLPETDIVTEGEDDNEVESSEEEKKPSRINEEEIPVEEEPLKGEETIVLPVPPVPSPKPSTSSLKPPLKKPVPLARSPRSKAKMVDNSYANFHAEHVEPTTTTTSPIKIITPPEEELRNGDPHNNTSKEEEEEQVRLRRPRQRKMSRDETRIRRQSINNGFDPSKGNYDIPRLAAQDYKIPPREVRPVAPPALPGRFLTVQDMMGAEGTSSSPILKKKTGGSIPVSKDGYLYMEPVESDGAPKEPVHVKYAGGGEFVEVPRGPQRLDSKDPHRGLSIPLVGASSLGSSCSSLDTYSGSSNNTQSPPLPVESQSSTRKISHPHYPSAEPDPVPLDPVDEELIQLMKAFTSGEYTSQQLELLVENWKTRPDVMKSVEEKQIYLKKLRKEYEQLQHQQAQTQPCGGVVTQQKERKFFSKVKDIFGTKKKSSVTTPKLEPSGNSKFQVVEDSQNYQEFINGEQRRDSHGSGSGGSGSSVSDEPDPSKGDPLSTGRTLSNASSEVSSTSSPRMYRNPLDNRFIPSYVPPLPMTSPTPSSPHPNSEILGLTFHNQEYQIPPPPRPVTEPHPRSSPPQKPPRNGSTSGGEDNVPPPPAVPKKPKHLRKVPSEEEENPPPPPPRTYMKPNPFNYIDYSSRSKNGNNGSSTNNNNASSNKKAPPRCPSPYDNLKEEMKMKE